MILPGILSSQISGHLFTLTGSYDALATVTVGAGGTTAVTFAGIPSGYKSLQIKVMTLFTNARMDILFNGDTGANYSYHLVQGDGASTYTEAGASTNSIKVWPNGNTSTSGIPNVAIIDVLDYANVSKNKTARILNGFDQNGSGIISLNSGSWYNTSAINAITILPNTGSFAQYSQISLYGVK
jgi:hypothetical protein